MVSKAAVAAASTGVLGTGGTGVFVAHQMGAFGNGSGWKSPTLNSQLSHTVEDFRKNDGGQCMEWIFKKSLPSNGKKLLADTANLDTVKAEHAKLGTNAEDKVDGCLLINWEKLKGTADNKWGGNFQMEWALSKGGAGFSVYLSGKTNNQEGMDFEGVAYVFEKGEDSAWKPKSQLKLKEANKTLSREDLKTKFPKKGEGFSDDAQYYTSVTQDENWELWELLDKEGKIREVEDTSRENDMKFNKLMPWTNASTSSTGSYRKFGDMKKWSSNLDVWWKHFFDDGTNWDITKTIEGISGFWQ